MKSFFTLFLTFLISITVFGQTKTNLQKLVETEIAFAQTAEAKGTKTAFLEFLSDEAIIFRPSETNGKTFWKTQPESSALLVWRPSWADISSDGNLGYTTGGWELRPKGKNGEATGFGQYVTVWQKLPDGSFKAVIDNGISFDKSVLQKEWKSPKDAGIGEKAPKPQVDLNVLTDIFSKKKLSSGYFDRLADDVIVLREKHQPFIGKKEAFIGLENLDSEFPPDGFLNLTSKTSKNYGNLMYAWGVYQLTLKDKTIRKWNFMQIWKYREGKWQIVVDVLSPLKG